MLGAVVVPLWVVLDWLALPANDPKFTTALLYEKLVFISQWFESRLVPLTSTPLNARL